MAGEFVFLLWMYTMIFFILKFYYKMLHEDILKFIKKETTAEYLKKYDWLIILATFIVGIIIGSFQVFLLKYI